MRSAAMTVFTPELEEGGKGGEGSVFEITNAEFIAAAFHNLPDAAFAAVCTKTGDPDIGGWSAQRADKAIEGFSTDDNNYLNCSSFYFGGDGSFRALKAQFAAYHFLMLDDIGTKIPFERLAGIALSFLIETSPGNHQGGIILADPVTDNEVAVRLLNAVIEAGLCDPGASGPSTRWARLPVAINGKPKHAAAAGVPFRCRLIEWRPDMRYTPGEIVARLGLELTPTAPLVVRSASVDGLIPEGARNSTLTSLAGSMRRKGMSPDAILAALLIENTERCEPPLPESEICSIAKSVSRYVPDETASQPTYSRKELAAMIEATDDFDELTGHIAGLVGQSDLLETERDFLRKAIAKKSKVSVASLKVDGKAYQQVSATRSRDHLSASRQTIVSFGEGNLIHAQGSLWHWDASGVWRKTEDREIKQKIHQVSASAELTSSIVSSVLDMIKTEANSVNHEFNVGGGTINCMNGELESDEHGKWRMLPHNREHYHTARLPVAYDPAATAPRFSQYLKEIFQGDPDSVEKEQIVLEALGYTLIRDCHLEKFFMLIGNGANGKSALLKVLTALVGKEYVAAVQPSQFENKFQRAHLHGKLANIITELSVGAEIADAQLKAMVSGEITTAEHKFCAPFDFMPYAKHWFGTNHLPHTRDLSDAFFRRAIVLKFNNEFNDERRDVHLDTKLRLELPGILNLALDGLGRLKRNNQFTICSSSEEITKKWRRDADQVALFVEEACEIGLHFRTASDELYRHYQSWANDAGIKLQLNKNNFTSRMEILGYERARTSGVRQLTGVRPQRGAIIGYAMLRGDEASHSCSVPH